MHKRKRMAWVWQWMFFFSGLWTISLGTVFAIKSDLGVAPWDVLHIGLARVSSLSIGTWVTVLGIVIVAVTCWLKRSYPQWGTFLNMLLLGPFIDLIMFINLIPDVRGWVLRLVYLTVGVALVAFGVGLYCAAHRGGTSRRVDSGVGKTDWLVDSRRSYYNGGNRWRDRLASGWTCTYWNTLFLFFDGAVNAMVHFLL